MNQIQTEVIFLNLLRQADEFVFAILGTNPTPDAGSFRARVSALFDIFNADKYNFVRSPVHLGFLATLIKEYAAFRKSEISQIGTPEILIGQIRWEDIYDKPDILAASSDWADITNKPATFAPSAHGHAYSEITDKPATFAPSAHGHAYSEITGKPTTFAPSAHGHAYSEITDKPTTFAPSAHTHTYTDLTSTPATYPPDAHAHAYADITDKPATFAGKIQVIAYTGNGNATRTLALSGAFTPVCGVVTNLAGTAAWTCWDNNHLSSVSANSIVIDVNASSASLKLILWG